MLKWIVAAIGIFVVSLAISGAHMYLSDAATRRPFDPKAYEQRRQISIQYEPVSLIRLLAEPEQYEGRKVRVSGFVTLGFEDCGLHIDETAYKAGLRRNALWLDRPNWLTEISARRLGHRYAEVAGTFKLEQLGHLGLYSGSLTDIRSIQPTYTSADYERMRLRVSREVLTREILSGWFLTIWGWMGLAALWTFTRSTSSERGRKPH